MASTSPSTFRQSLSIIVPAFINKCGSVGMDLVPMLLVIRKVSPIDASIVMASIKSAMFVGAFFGGWLGDRVGVRRSFILSFMISGLGMSVLPFTEKIWVLCIFGALAQVGLSMFPSTARLIVFELLPKRQQQEGIGWLRSANNLGQVVSYSIAGLASTFGFVALMIFDAICSFGAALAGYLTLKRHKMFRAEPLEQKAVDVPVKSNWGVFFVLVIVVTFQMFIYSMFIVATPALCQLHFGSEGLKTFSMIMLTNTILCSALAVVASRTIHSPWVSTIGGAFLNGFGFLLVVLFVKEKSLLLTSVFILTFGEILFSSMAPFLVARLTPEGKNKGSVFGGAMVIQNIGRFAGSTLAFPLIVYGTHPTMVISLSTAFVLIASTIFCRYYSKSQTT